MIRIRLKYVFFLFIFFFFNICTTNALTGIVNVNDSLTLRDRPTTGGAMITKFYNATELNILNTNAGSGNGCSGNWYQVSYGGYTGYSCGDFIVLRQENNVVYRGDDDTYSSSNYQERPSGDGTVMCYEDTGSLSLRNSVNGSRTGAKVNCGDSVDILKTEDRSGTTCPYWYQVKRGNDVGYVCGYFVNTTKLSSTAINYYQNNIHGDTIESYTLRLKEVGFPDSYIPYLLELHARHDNWNFVVERIPMKFDDAINGEAIDGRNLLQRTVAFDDGYLSTAAHTFDIVKNEFKGYASEPGYYNASKEAIAYYMDPRNYLNEKYIFAFETLGYSENQNQDVIASILSGQSFWPTVYDYYTRAGAIQDSYGSVNADIVAAAADIGISAVHVASRIRQEITGLSTSDSRIGGNFTYMGNGYSSYYNFFNIKSSCTNCSSIYSGYAYEKGWNTPFKGIYGGSKFMYDGYISLNQDTIYYEKFDVSTTNGHFTHQYMQNLAAPVQEGGIKHKGYVNAVSSYLNTGITFVIPVYDEMPNYAVTAPKLGNPNNYLNSLTVNGSGVSNFSYDTYHYNVYLNSNVTSVDIGASTFAATSNVAGIGRIEINSNDQFHDVVVTSQNGKKRTYKIHFERQINDETTVVDAMNHSGFKYNNNHLFGISVGTNVSQLIGNMSSYNNTVSVSVLSSDGNVKTNDSFRTGDKVKVTAMDGTKEYTVVIFGDVDGDGVIGKRDLLSVQSKVFGYSNFDDLKNMAGDINKDGVVDKKDLLSVQSHVFGYSQINQG